MANDARVHWLASHVAAHRPQHIDANAAEQILTSARNLPCVIAFLDDAQLVLFATIHEAKNISVSIELDPSTAQLSTASTLAFVKTAAGPVHGVDVSSQVLVTSLNNGSLSSLFHTLRHVYVPLISSVDQCASPELSSLLSQVDALLAKESGSASGISPLHDVSAIANPIDEV
jgi:hypothetical protein